MSKNTRRVPSGQWLQCHFELRRHTHTHTQIRNGLWTIWKRAQIAQRTVMDGLDGGDYINTHKKREEPNSLTGVQQQSSEVCDDAETGEPVSLHASSAWAQSARYAETCHMSLIPRCCNTSNSARRRPELWFFVECLNSSRQTLRYQHKPHTNG
jgi:hypothetical protein